MSSSGPRYHIPFPKTFLSLNTPVKKTNKSADVVTSPESGITPSHTFLSNRPVDLSRHASVSSVTSVASAAGEASSPPTKPADSPVLRSSIPAFLTLNSKYATPPTTAKEMSGEKSSFLSNRH